jgi:DNA-directed RNA polymerase subunit RPC12/RpoP
MVVIQCPHCSLEVELDDGISGLFDCPHCGEEFEWEEGDEEIDPAKHRSMVWQGWAIILILILVNVLVYLMFGSIPFLRGTW